MTAYTYPKRRSAMQTTKVFKSGNSQVIRIPKNDPWGLFKKSLGEFTGDYFVKGRNQPRILERVGS
jgi:hypothetical protein